MKYNRVELLLIGDQYYDAEYQPYKDNGLYILDSTTFVLYEAGGVSHERMMKFIERVVTHKDEVEDPEGRFYTKNKFECFDDFTIRDANHIQFDFIHIARGAEEVLLPYLKKGEEIAGTVSFACLRDGNILTALQSKKVFEENVEYQRVKTLEGIANWQPNPENIFNDIGISTFCNEHFKGKSQSEIKIEYKELSKIHHPDKGGEELMFRAITRAKEYLLNKRI